MRRHLASLATLLFAALPLFAQTGGGVEGSGPKFHLIRSVSGSKGSQQGGRYSVEDPRSIFYLGSDKQVIVYFEWQGPIGRHHFEGYWKGAAGNSMTMSAFDYEAKEPRFGAYWILELSDATVPGVWSLEAHVDGEVTGTHTFQIVATQKPPSIEIERKLLSPAEVYQRALQATVTIEKFRSNGDRLGTYSGFLLEDGRLVTAFQAIDGADLVRVQLPDGKKLETSTVSAWNRWQDWALLQVATDGVAKLPMAKAASWAVGDRCFFLNVNEGNRTIVDGNITGSKKFSDAGDRMDISALPAPDAIGSPLLNEYGEVIGIVGANVIPGADSLLSKRYRYYGGLNLTGEPMSLPIELVGRPKPADSPVGFLQLAQSGQFVTPLSKTDLVIQGSLGANVDMHAGFMPAIRDEKGEYTPQDRQCYVFLIWNPQKKQNGLVSMRVYDLDNHLLSQGKPSKLKLGGSQPPYSTWKITMADIKPGFYRVDVVLDDQPVWRTFFKMTD